MKLDERFELLPFCCFGAEKCVKYIGQKGYFTNNIDFFKNIDFCIYGTLEEVHAEQADSFQMYNRKFFRYFIPEYFVKPKEKKYRPYKTISEFFEKENLETYSKIRIRNKNCQYDSQVVHIVGFGQKKIDDGYVEYLMLGCHEYSLENLFANYEFQLAYTEDYKPFGVEE